MIAVIDYGAGNLGSVYKALRYVGADAVITNDPDVVASAESLVLPGVGAFAHCMRGLENVNLTQATRDFIDSGRPFLGICVGLQMLFDESEEMGATPGLGLLRGKVVRFDFDDHSPLTTQHSAIKVPHIGWNEIEFEPDSPLFAGLNQGDRAYFVHSYYPEPIEESIISARTEYGYRFCCAVQKDNIYATQFHPEKSGAVGLQILRNFVSLGA